MATDPIIKDAIIQSVKDSGQEKNLEKKIIAWMDSITEGNEKINDTEEAFGHLDAIFLATSIEEGEV